MTEQADTRTPQRAKMSRIRRRIASNMVHSLATSAHVTMSVDISYAAVDEIRREHRETWRAQHGFSLTYLPFVARAVVEALARFPDLNAAIEDAEMVRYPFVNLGIAVDLGGRGLVVPVIGDADTMSLGALAVAAHNLAKAASDKRLTPNDVQGGTFTLTSPGRRGADRSTPIINQPEVGILSIDAIQPRPIARGDGTIAIEPVGALSLSFDHRAVDGVYASEFLRDLQDALEHAEWDPRADE